MSFIKYIIRWFNSLFHTLHWFFFQLYHENFRNYIKNETQTKPLTILANGPSLNSVIENQLDQIFDGDIIMVNDAPLSHHFEKIKPCYHILADPIYWDNSAQARAIGDPIMDALIAKTTWSLVLFIPYVSAERYNFRERLKTNNHITVTLYHSATWNGFKSYTHTIYSMGLSMPRLQNVVVGAIFNGINMGYKHIDLYGVEHSYLTNLCVNENNQVCLKFPRFYEDESEAILQPWYKNDEPYKMHEILRDVANMFESYHQLSIYAIEKNVQIINHTKESFIDAFKRR